MRAALQEKRGAISASERESMAAKITERLVRVLDGCHTVMLFMSTGAEVPTDGMCERLAAEGHRLVVPHVEAGEMTPVEFAPGESLAEAVLGIREPVNLRPVQPSSVDAVVAPGLGLDREGNRLGRGGGYYDRFLRRCRPDVLRVGIAFDMQIMTTVPHGEGDEAVDVVVTDRETVHCR
jgi:5-formyltetrahydrofolate cyclo-ligase